MGRSTTHTLPFGNSLQRLLAPLFRRAPSFNCHIFYPELFWSAGILRVRPLDHGRTAWMDVSNRGVCDRSLRIGVAARIIVSAVALK